MKKKRKSWVNFDEMAWWLAGERGNWWENKNTIKNLKRIWKDVIININIQIMIEKKYIYIYISWNATWVYNHILLILKYYVSMTKSNWLWNHIQNIGWWWLIAPSKGRQWAGSDFYLAYEYKGLGITAH